MAAKSTFFGFMFLPTCNEQEITNGPKQKIDSAIYLLALVSSDSHDLVFYQLQEMQLCNLVMKKMTAIKDFILLKYKPFQIMPWDLSYLFSSYVVFFSFFGNTTSLMFIDQRKLLFPAYLRFFKEKRLKIHFQICLMRRNEYVHVCARFYLIYFLSLQEKSATPFHSLERKCSKFFC